MQSFYTGIDTMYNAVISFCLYFFVKMQHATDVTSVEENSPFKDISSEKKNTETESFKPMRTLLRTSAQTTTDAIKNTVMYTGNISVPMYQNPTIEFDAQMCSIPYGEMVMMLEPQGRFFKIVWNTQEGWVLRDDLVDRAIRVYPEFMIGQENSVDHSNTAHVRAILSDVFSLSRSEFPLQAGEYILYRLWKKGIHIVWPEVRPRVPGVWHKILKGVSNVNIGVTPKVGAIMEYMINSDVGHLAYVEAVFPDETFTISEVNYPDSGMYNERVLVKEEWKKLKPVFIRIGQNAL